MKMERVLFALALCTGFAVRSMEGSEATINNDRNQDVQSSNQAVNPVIQWNKNLLVIVRTPGVQSPTIHSTHSFAIMHAAIYDAVNAIDRRHKPYLIRLARPEKDASQNAAADAAAHEVMVALYPSFKTSLDAEFRPITGADPRRRRQKHRYPNRPDSSRQNTCPAEQ